MFAAGFQISFLYPLYATLYCNTGTFGGFDRIREAKIASILNSQTLGSIASLNS